jgi:hypothetical protein
MSLEENEGRLKLNFNHQVTFDLSIENRDLNKPMQVSIGAAREIYWEMKARLDELGKELEKRKALEEETEV